MFRAIVDFFNPFPAVHPSEPYTGDKFAPSFPAPENFYLALQEENQELKDRIEELEEENTDLQNQIDELNIREP